MEDNLQKSTQPARRKTARWKKNLGKSIAKSKLAAAIISKLGVGYLEFVYWTNRFSVEPENALDVATPHQPAILAVWHGQHILLPALRINMPASVMISRSFDGEIQARIAEAYGAKPIRASGGRDKTRILEKGGIQGFREMLSALEAGENVVQTADIPKGTPRRACEGIIRLAAKSGRPIIPLAVASSRRYTFKKAWDGATFNLPFGRTAICMGAMIKVPASKDKFEECRIELENELNQITNRAYQMVGASHE
ncbi:MAG: lysophospholipid acyltransferase family protein [Rhizobiaceae bacterium]|nr:lysophospholipid acyltransferase family protein [Rhizobiaceae bacterium]